jgi:hypothetical protein
MFRVSLSTQDSDSCGALPVPECPVDDVLRAGSMVDMGHPHTTMKTRGVLSGGCTFRKHDTLNPIEDNHLLRTGAIRQTSLASNVCYIDGVLICGQWITSITRT